MTSKAVAVAESEEKVGEVVAETLLAHRRVEARKFIEAHVDARTSKLKGREEQLKIGLLALIAGQHVVFLGPPGTAKSLLCETLCDGWLEKPESPPLKAEDKSLSAWFEQDKLKLPDELKTIRFPSWLTEGNLQYYGLDALASLPGVENPHLLPWLIGCSQEFRQLMQPRSNDTTWQERMKYFQILLTKFTTPPEVFGPMSLEELKRGRYFRLTDRYLPQSYVAFIDEVFKANSAILNALLTIMNERVFVNEPEDRVRKLDTVFAASNEFPEDSSLNALYDRFLLRSYVGYLNNDQNLDQSDFRMLVEWASKKKQIKGSSLTSVDLFDNLEAFQVKLKEIRSDAGSVDVPTEIQQFIGHLRNLFEGHSDKPSDRRWTQVVSLLKIIAWTNGESSVCFLDCVVLQHCLWERPKKFAELESGDHLRKVKTMMVEAWVKVASKLPKSLYGTKLTLEDASENHLWLTKEDRRFLTQDLKSIVANLESPNCVLCGTSKAPDSKFCSNCGKQQK